MNIFYFSVHHVLEDDEVRMLKSIGHNVFCLGSNGRTGANQDYRPSIQWNSVELHLHDVYLSLGGKYMSSLTPDEALPPGFADHFSVFIVMHEAGFFMQNWDKIKSRAVVWRTIGQGLEEFEDILRPYRDDGLKIVRYCPREINIARSMGQDMIIRFGKDPNVYRGWTGITKQVTSFCGAYQRRYPQEAADYSNIADHIPAVLYGKDNETMPNSAGFVSSERQIDVYKESSAYLYASAMYVPYTLNFIEAWMTGTPVILYAPLDRVTPNYEMDSLVKDGESGFVCRDKASVVDRARLLLADHDLGARVGTAGRMAAIARFGLETISAQWSDFLDSIDRFTPKA